MAAAPLATIGSSDAQPSRRADLPTIKPKANASFASLKQIEAGVLNVGYAEAGPVILLHGWPYDIHSYVDVAPLLASAGYHVVVPYLRGSAARKRARSHCPRRPSSNGGTSTISPRSGAVPAMKNTRA